MSDFIFPKVGQIIEGEVFMVKKEVVIITLGAATEGTIYAEHFDQPAPADLRKVVKVGQKVRAKVTSVSEGDDSSVILLSRLPLLQEERLAKIKEIADSQKRVDAIVKGSNAKGLTLDYEGFEFFLPFTLLDFELKDKIDSLVNKPLTVVFEEVKKENKRLKLIASRKPIFEEERSRQQELRQQQRQDELDNIHTGDVIEGVVDVIEPHAAFIKFNHVSGMLRISQVSHHRIDKIDDVLKKGDKVTVKVIKKEGNRLDLSIKALLPTPFAQFKSEHKVGDRVKGVVVSKLPFGVILEMAKDVKGLLHKNEYSWNPKDNFDAYLKIGDEIEVAILSIDSKNEKISLSKRAIEYNPWSKLNLRLGEVIQVRVEKVTNDGIFISYESVDGFIPAKEAHNDPKVNIADHYQVGDVVEAKVIEFDKEGWNLKLSVKKLLDQRERAEYEKYLGDQEEETIKLGDLIDLEKK